MEQLVLFPKGLVLLIDMRLCNLECHVLICHLGDIGDVKHSCETEDKNPNRQIYPLDTLQSRDIISRLGEEGIRTKHRSHHCADGIKCLSEIDSNLGIPGRTTNYRCQLSRA